MRARQRIRDYLDQHGVGVEVANEVVLAIEEAMTNAVRHSGAGADLEVRLRFVAGDLHAEVEDKGKGFDVDSFDPDRVPDPLLPGGRGLFLIAQLMDEMELVHDGGVEVRMLRRAVLPESRAWSSLETGIVDAHLLEGTLYREQRLKRVVEELGEGYASLDWEYRFTHANHVAYGLYDMGPSEVLGRTVWDLFPHIEETPLGRAIRDAVELGTSAIVEFESQAVGRWIECRAYPTGSGASLYLRDIDERKHRELERDEYLEALLDSEERFRSLFTNMTEGVALHEIVYEQGEASDYVVGDVNPAFETQTGISAEQARGALASQLYGVEEPPFLAEYVEVAHGESPLTFETYFAPLRRHFRVTALSLGGARFATVFEDVSEAVRARDEREQSLRALLERERELRESREQFRTMGEALDYGVWLADKDGRAEYVSESFLELLDMTMEEQQGFGWTHRLVPEDVEPMMQHWLHCVRTGELWDYEHRIVDRHGEIHTVLTRGKPIRDESGAITSWVGINLDITARKNAEQALRDSETRFRALVTASSEVLYRMSPDWSEMRELQGGAFLADTGAPTCTWLEEYIPPEDRERVGAAIERAIRARSVFQLEHRVRRADGTVGWTSSRAVPVLDAGGEIVEWFGFAADVTERRAAEEALRETARLNEALASIDRLVHSSLRSDEIIQAALREGAEAIGAETAALSLHEDAEQRFRVAYVYNYPDDKVGILVPDRDDTHGVEAMRTGQTLRIDDTDTDPRVARELMRAWGIESVICAPVVAGGRPIGVVYYNYHGDAHHFSPQEADFVTKLASSFSDALENARLHAAERAAAERSRLLLEAADVLAGSLSLDEILGRLLDVVQGLTGRPRAFVNAVDEERRELRTLAARGPHLFPPGTVTSFDSLAPFTQHAIRERQALVLDYEAEPDLRRVREQLHAHLVLYAPLIAEERLIGHIGVDTPDEREPFDERDIELVKGIASQAAVALQKARLFEEVVDRERLATALNDINALVHSTLDVDEIMRRAVERARQEVGSESVMVAMKRGDAWVAEYGSPALPGLIRESVTSDEAPFVLTAVSERRPVVIDDCDNDARCLPEVQRRLGVRSVLCIPLIARDEVLGVIFFNHHRAPVRFEPRIVDFAGKLAAAVSSALENARRFAEQQRIATTLQENLLHPLPTVHGLEFAVHSLPANTAELVGGDFSDVFVLADGRVVVLIGDVAGKGIRAAGLTETVRSTVRTLSAIDSSPAFILRRTNELLMRYESAEPHVTACFCLLDPTTGHVSVGSAGHPGPVHLTRYSCEILDPPFGPPLGTFPTEHSSMHLTLTLDDYLVLYTDGVTEARRDGELFGERRLVEVVQSLRGRSAQEVAEGVAAAALSFAGRLRDDLQVVVVRPA